MPGGTDGIDEGAFAVTIIVVGIGQDAGGSSLATWLLAVMKQINGRLTQSLQQILSYLIISVATIETHLTLFIGNLGGID